MIILMSKSQHFLRWCALCNVCACH